MKILLIEPNYKSKYPPLGLMKIAQYHYAKKHRITFYKGFSPEYKKKKWDKIYISTLFTFYWRKTIKTIKYYKNSVKDISHIYVGGAMATLLAEDLRKEIPGITVVKGLINNSQILGFKDSIDIDALVPNYKILNQLEYKYPKSNAYIAYMTRSCPNNCDFCAVRDIEPSFNFNTYISIKDQIKIIKKLYGEKKDLLLLDNNVLASKKFREIIKEIIDLGFKRGAKLNGRLRCVDFNQGLDARRLTKEKMKLLSKIAINPLRIAFDNIKFEKAYIEKIRWAAEYGIKMLSNYILFNFKDTPEDFYRRLQINIELNEELSQKDFTTKIWSFPMKYVPLYGEASKNRKFVGKNWNKKYLRGIQCILLATHGVVGPKRAFFEKAFGRDVTEFKEILIMPEDYIIHRFAHEGDGSTHIWQEAIRSLDNAKFNEMLKILMDNNYHKDKSYVNDNEINAVLSHY